MKKKIICVFVVLLAVVMLTTPVIAAPTKGQKVAISLMWTNRITEVIEEKISGNVVHSHQQISWDVELAIDGGPTFYGTALVDRKLLVVPQKDAFRLVMQEYYMLSFPNDGGGFEGNCLLMLDGFDYATFTWDVGKEHGLFKGTGAFEGQTINTVLHWGPPAGFVWTGYLLKP